MRPINPPCIVSIAGTDPSGGAGISADIKAISATGGYAAPIITALVAQNTQGVMAIQEVSTDFVQQQMHCVFSDLDVQAVKIGMLHDKRIIETVFTKLKTYKPNHVVFDPVMLAKDGSVLLDLNGVEFLKQQLIGVVNLITPNLFEAEHLIGSQISTTDDMETAAICLGTQLQLNVLLKGGHSDNQTSSDVLYLRQQNQCHWFHAERVITKNTHGTGCTLSSAIASYLGQGLQLIESVDLAKAYLTQAIKSGANHLIGQGNGPVDHFYFLNSESLLHVQ